MRGPVGGSPYAQEPPGNALLAKEQAALARQQAGKNPSFNPVQGLKVAGNALLHGTQTPAQHAAEQRALGPIHGSPVFGKFTSLLPVIENLPSQVAAGHKLAVKIAHPSKANPPSLGQNFEGLISGVFGVPRLGVSDQFKPRGVTTHIPRVPKGQTTPETAGELGKQVRESLRGAKGVRTQQDKLYSAERSKRAGAAEQAMTEIGGQAGYKAALGKLKGELPKLQFGGFENFDQNGLDALFTHVQNHPTLRPFDKIRTQKALLNALNGKVPTKGELNLLSQVFGKEVSGRIAASIPFWAKAKNLGLEILNVPRSIMSSFDLSAPFRQGLVAGAGHPKIFFKNFVPMVKAFGSEKVYKSVMEDIASRPTFQKMTDSGLSLTDLEGLTTREEQFVSNLAEKIPVVGHGIRASGRAYTGFLTKTRADVFDSLLKTAEQQGLDTNDPKLLSSISKYVNSATGRGDLGALKDHAVSLNTLFFSPRLLASRVNFLNPVYYAKLDPFARMQALRSMRNLVGALGLVLYLAQLGGAEVNSDPRNADFGKIKIGNTRIDILGGFQQPVRLMAQLFSGKVVSSTTGKTLNLGPQGPGKLSRFDIAQRFVESKLGPVPSFVKDVGKGVDSTGKKLDWGLTRNNPAFQRMLPLLVQDAADLNKADGIGAAIAGYGVGAFGVGLQTYGPNQPATSVVPQGGGGYGGGGSYGGSYGGSSGGSPYGK